MKKLLFFSILLLSSFIGFTQAKSKEIYYKAISTEMYVKSVYTNKYELHQKNGTTNITIVVEDNFISIQAQKPSIYRIYKDEMKEVNDQSSYGTRYVAKDLKSEKYCFIDVLKMKEYDAYIIDIMVDEFMLRYYINPN